MISEKWEGRASPFQIFFWQGVKGAKANFLFFADTGGRGGLDPQFWADIICDRFLALRLI